MKKVLFGSTALVAAAFAGSAFANDVELSIGGYLDFGAGVGKVANDGGNVQKDVHIITNGEIQFKGKGTLDNGITVEVRIELEGYSATGASEDEDADTETDTFATGNQTDELWGAVSSSFGKIMVGYNDNAMDLVAGGIGRMGAGYAGGSWDASYEFVPGTITTHVGGEGDDAAIHYYTPNIAGFEAGISWAPGTGHGSNSDIDTNKDLTNSNDVLAAAASYSNSFGDVDFTIGGGYVTFDSDSELTYTGWGVGAEVGFSGFTVGGRYEDVEQETTGGDDDTTRFGGGVTYATGPWEFGVNAAYEDFDDASSTTGDYESVRVNFGASYELGDGVTAGAYVDYGDIDYDGGSANDDDAWGGALLMGVSF